MNRENAKALLEQRARDFEEAKALNDAVDAENRDFNAEEQAQWDRINTAIDTADKRIAQYLEVEEREARADEARSRVESLTRPGQAPVETAERNEEEDFFRGLGPNHYEARDLVKGTSASGGYTVPVGFVPELQRYLVENSAVLAMQPRMLNTQNGEDITVPKVTAYGSAALALEGSAGAESDDTFAAATLKAFKYAILVQVSRELLEDSGVDIISYIAEDSARKVANVVGSKFIAGTGTAEPQGIFVGASTAVTAASASLTVDNLIDLMHSVVTGYRRNGVFLMKDSTAAAVRKLKDGQQQYLWQPTVILGQPDVLLGHAVYTDPDVDAVATGKKSVAFGDPKGYFVRQVNNVALERSDEFAFGSGLSTFRCDVRIDGQLIHANAWKLLIHA